MFMKNVLPIVAYNGHFPHISRFLVIACTRLSLVRELLVYRDKKKRHERNRDTPCLEQQRRRLCVHLARVHEVALRLGVGRLLRQVHRLLELVSDVAVVRAAHARARLQRRERYAR